MDCSSLPDLSWVHPCVVCSRRPADTATTRTSRAPASVDENEPDKFYFRQFGHVAQFGALNPCPNPRPCLPISASLLCIASAFAPRHLSLTCTHGCCGGGGVCPGRRTTSLWCQRCCCRAARVATFGGGVPRAPRADPHRVGLGAHSSVCVLPPRVPRRSTGEPTPTRTRAPPASPTT